jgi:hypothetical protein
MLILEEEYMYDQKLSGFTKYSYDDTLRLGKTEIFNFDETIIQTIEHKYRGNNTLPIEEIYYDSDNELMQKRQLIYDGFDNLTAIKVVINKVTHTLFRKKYNGKMLIEYIQYAPTWGYTEWFVSRYEYEKIN